MQSVPPQYLSLLLYNLVRGFSRLGSHISDGNLGRYLECSISYMRNKFGLQEDIHPEDRDYKSQPEKPVRRSWAIREYSPDHCMEFAQVILNWRSREDDPPLRAQSLKHRGGFVVR